MKKRRKIVFFLVAVLLALFLGRDSIHRLYYRISYKDIIRAQSARQGVSPHLVAALIFNESRFRADAVSQAGALGLMQLMPETARELALENGYRDFDKAWLSDPEFNIRLGTIYLARLRTQFGKEDLALAAYNAGPHQVAVWLERGVGFEFPETRAYVSNIMRHRATLENLYPEWSQPGTHGSIGNPPKR